MPPFVRAAGTLGVVFQPHSTAHIEPEVLRKGITANQRSTRERLSGQRGDSCIQGAYDLLIDLGMTGGSAAMKCEQPIRKTEKRLGLLFIPTQRRQR